MSPKKQELTEDFLHLARIALSGRQQDIQLMLHRASKRYKEVHPQMSDGLISLLQESPTRSSPLRKHTDTPLPVDLDSRLQLLRIENAALEYEPILSKEIDSILQQILNERRNSKSLLKHGLHPTKSLLFVGPPGVGKTLAAKWLAYKLNKPLLVLDLAAVMSSFLGRTGNNIRFVLDYAKNTDCILLLDEVDAIAKRRDDSTEIGELKRLVTVLLQEIDDWPSSGLLLAATNHPDLLDPAIWRRFEIVVRFTNPNPAQSEQLIERLIQPYTSDHGKWSKLLSYIFSGRSFSDIEREIMLCRKSAAITENPLSDHLETLIQVNPNLSHDQKVELACLLNDSGVVSQRRAKEITGVARETIRKYSEKPETKSIKRKK